MHAGGDLLIVHEPTFWEHSLAEKSWRRKETGTAKSKLLAESGLVILRIHAVGDHWPEIGVRDSWAKYLGLTNRWKERKHLRLKAVYEISPMTLEDFAQQIADRILPLGEDSVPVLGDVKRIVRYPALGTGGTGPDEEMIRLSADVRIVCYDGASYGRDRERFVETGAAVITVEHGTSEMPGLRNLKEHLAQQFPAGEFIWLVEHPRTRTIKGRPGKKTEQPAPHFRRLCSPVCRLSEAEQAVLYWKA